MKPPAFDYVRPGSLPEAFALLKAYREDAKILAGGQSLLATLNMRLSAPALLVDINNIEGLSDIALVGNVLRIGATVRHYEVGSNSLVRHHASLISEAVPHIAHAAIRNRGTFGGSLAFADPAAELPACVVALDAQLILEGHAGTRKVAAKDFFRGLYSTALEPDEILLGCEIPLSKPTNRHGFAELSRRQGDYAIIGLAASVEMNDRRFADARLVYISAGDTPVIARAASAALVGRVNSSETRDLAAAALADDLSLPQDLNADAPMRLHLARVLTRRVLENLQT